MSKIKKIHTTILAGVILILLSCGVSGCRDGFRLGGHDIPNQSNVETNNEDGWFTTQFMIESEGLNIPTIRALTEEGENEIKQEKVRMLVFDKNNNFHYEAKVLKVEPSTNPVDKKRTGKLTILAQNSKPGDTSTFVLLTNVEASAAPSLTEGASMDEVLKLFTFQLPTDGSWADGGLPMWGVSAPVVVNHNSGATPQIGTIPLVRAVARVDIGLGMSQTTGGASQFNEVADGISYATQNGQTVQIKLTKVYVYNTNGQGRIAPISEDAAVWDKVARKAKAPSLPSPAPASVLRINKSSKIKDGKLLLRDIYLPEAVNSEPKATQGANGTTLVEGEENYLKRPYLVVGLVGADRAHPEKETFFRIDYLERTGTEPTASYKYLSLLRNHRYMVNITNVQGSGFDTEEEAMKGPAANIMYNVIVWNESNMSNVQYDGQYMLGVSEDELVYYNHSYSQSITVHTDWPKGWAASVTSGADWLSVSNTTAAAGIDTQMDITVADNRTEEAQVRMGEITITAGRMSWKVKVKQLNEGSLSVQIYDVDGITPISMLKFTGQEETKKIIVDYLPTNGIFSLLTDTPNFTFVKVSENNGRAEYNVTSKTMTGIEDFESFSDAVNFTVSDGGKTAGKALSIIQTEYNAVPYEDNLKTIITNDHFPLYLLDGKDKNFFIKANAKYDLKLVNNDAEGKEGVTESLQLIESGFTLNQVVKKRGVFQGEKFTFKPYDDFPASETAEGYKRSYGFAEFELSSPDGLFPTRRFKIMLASGKIQPEANAYMMKPKSIGILIPVSRINMAKTFYDSNSDQFSDWYLYSLNELSPSEKWEADLIWSDMENIGTRPVNSDGSAGLKFVKRVNESSGDSKYIYVLPGSGNKDGNALISCRKTNDNAILWSWHLWVLNEYPHEISNKWLDRNLGATAVATEFNDDNTDTHGLQYQFGRKDPFPVEAHLKQSTRRLVSADGTEFRLNQTDNDVRYTMKKTISEPARIVRNYYNWQTETSLNYTNDVKKRIWYNLWGGSINNDNSFTIDLHTVKTVFDPSPYGWKVPAQGMESDWRNDPNINLVYGKVFKNGNLNDDDNMLYGLSTVRDNTYMSARAIRYYNIGKGKGYLNNTLSRAYGRVIRCVKNDAEPDYLKYLP